MSQLYTVKMVRKQIISRFDTSGNKVAEEVVLLPQVYHDLPHSTALSYQTKFPDAQVEIVGQAHAVEGKSEKIGRVPSARERTARHWKPSGEPKTSEDLEVARDETVEGAKRGDFAATINSALEDA
jgi:hypothetical protein